MTLRTSNPTSPVDDRFNILKRGPSQRTLLSMGVALAAIACILPNKKEGEMTPSAPINQVDTETPPVQPTLHIDTSLSSSQDTAALSVVNVENYLQIISELEKKQQHDPNYKPNPIELEALELRRVGRLFNQIEPKNKPK